MNMCSSLFRRQFLGAACAPILMRQAAAQERDRGVVPFSYFKGKPLRIGNDVQLLADDDIIEDRWKLTRRQSGVAKHLRNPVTSRDEEINKYRMPPREQPSS